MAIPAAAEPGACPVADPPLRPGRRGVGDRRELRPEPRLRHRPGPRRAAAADPLGDAGQGRAGVRADGGGGVAASRRRAVWRSWRSKAGDRRGGLRAGGDRARRGRPAGGGGAALAGPAREDGLGASMSQTPEVADASAPPPRLADNAAWRDAAPRLSVLVPFFRDDPRPLVAALDAQAQGHGGAVELVLLDDAGGDAALSDAVEHAVASSRPPRPAGPARRQRRPSRRAQHAGRTRPCAALAVRRRRHAARAGGLPRPLAGGRRDRCAGGLRRLHRLTRTPTRVLRPAPCAVRPPATASPRRRGRGSRRRTVASSNLLVRRGVLEAEPFDAGLPGLGLGGCGLGRARGRPLRRRPPRHPRPSPRPRHRRGAGGQVRAVGAQLRPPRSPAIRTWCAASAATAPPARSGGGPRAPRCEAG